METEAHDVSGAPTFVLWTPLCEQREMQEVKRRRVQLIIKCNSRSTRAKERNAGASGRAWSRQCWFHLLRSSEINKGSWRFESINGLFALYFAGHVLIEWSPHPQPSAAPSPTYHPPMTDESHEKNKWGENGRQQLHLSMHRKKNK